MHLQIFFGLVVGAVAVIASGPSNCSYEYNPPAPGRTPSCKKSVRSCEQVLKINCLKPYCSSLLKVKTQTTVIRGPSATSTITAGETTVTDPPATVPGPIIEETATVTTATVTSCSPTTLPLHKRGQSVPPPLKGGKAAVIRSACSKIVKTPTRTISLPGPTSFTTVPASTVHYQDTVTLPPTTTTTTEEVEATSLIECGSDEDCSAPGDTCTSEETCEDNECLPKPQCTGGTTCGSNLVRCRSSPGGCGCGFSPGVAAPLCVDITPSCSQVAACSTTADCAAGFACIQQSCCSTPICLSLDACANTAGARWRSLTPDGDANATGIFSQST